MNFPSIVAFAIGAILIYAAVKNRDPRDVVKETLGIPTGSPVTTSPSAAPPLTGPGGTMNAGNGANVTPSPPLYDI